MDLCSLDQGSWPGNRWYFLESYYNDTRLFHFINCSVISLLIPLFQFSLFTHFIIYLFVCLFIYMYNVFIYLFINLCIYLFIYLLDHVFILIFYSLIYLFVCLPILFICINSFLYLFVYLCHYLFIYLFDHSFIYLIITLQLDPIPLHFFILIYFWLDFLTFIVILWVRISYEIKLKYYENTKTQLSDHHWGHDSLRVKNICFVWMTAKRREWMPMG